MSKSLSSPVSERSRQRSPGGSPSSRKPSAAKSSTSTKTPSPRLNRKSASTASTDTRRRGGRAPIARDRRSPCSVSSRASTSSAPGGSVDDQLAVVWNLCETTTEVDEQPPSVDRLQAMRDDLSRRRTEHETWRESFAQRSGHVVRAIERIGARRMQEAKMRMSGTSRKDATTEMDRVVLGSSDRWSSRHENCTASESVRRIHTQ